MAAGVDDILNDLIARVGRVRRWLFVLSTLRVAAAGLAGVSLYIGVYAWLDHRIHFGVLGRVSALVVFVAMIAAGLYRIVRVLRRDMTYAHAANYIEGRHSFDQQLVAAVEYYEGRSDYPYSEVLAGQLVRQVDAVSRTCRFDSAIAKWQGYLLSAFVLLCICVVGLFVRQNAFFVCSYLGRLLCPFSAIRPAPAMILASPTGDIVAGVDAPVTFVAEVEGRAPESVALVLARRDPNDANKPSEEIERIELTAAADGSGEARFTATKSFDAADQLEYRFETPDARSESHALRICELPSIKSVKAKVFPPGMSEKFRPQDAGEMPAARDLSPGAETSGPQDAGGTPATQEVRPYEQEWTGEPLAVLPHSRIELTARATTALREAVVVGPDGQPGTQSLDGADSFGFEFTADAPSSIKLSGVSTDGLASGEAKELRIVLRSDESPQFKLLSPQGDYLATDVASIPISFDVKDDFGLTSAELICELPGREPAVLQSALSQGARQLSLAHVLELERYDLHVGDSILFHARAQDVATGRRRADANACSEVYLIEIRPYRQYWHPLPGGGRPSSAPGSMEDLITVLEYTRAAVKKTWTLARAPGTAAEDRPKLDALSGDVRYCATRLAKIRDDPETGFSDGDKAVMNAILKSYEQAGRHLDGSDARAALPRVQEGYRVLRKFIDELHMNWTPPQSGPSPPQETPERVKLQEQPREPRMEKERIASRLKEMQQKIDSLARQQESLKADAAEALQQEKAAAGKKAGPGQGSAEESRGQVGEQASSGENGPPKSGGPGRQPAQPSGGEQGERTENGQAGRDGQGESQGQSGDGAGRSPAGMDAQMRMLQARQKALREQTSQLGEDMGSLPASEYSSQGRVKQQAKGHVDRAVEAMKQFEERLADARYKTPDSAQADDMTDLADSASRRLAEAGQSIRRGLLAEGDGSPDKAREMAEQLAQDAEAYDESLSEAEKQKMLDRLKAAQQLLESMAGAQWTTMSSGGAPGASHVYTDDPHATAADTARLLAGQFWSIALEGKERRSRPVEEEASDVEFFEAENDFFEEAARFGSQGVGK